MGFLIRDKLILYADDTSLSVDSINPTYLGFQLNFYLYKILDWCNYNHLSINVNKTKWIWFSRKRVIIPEIYLDGREVERVEQFKYLGFNLDEKFNHIKLLVAKLSRPSYISKRIRKFFTIEAAKNFILVLSSLFSPMVC